MYGQENRDYSMLTAHPPARTFTPWLARLLGLLDVCLTFRLDSRFQIYLYVVYMVKISTIIIYTYVTNYDLTFRKND